jgi:hypothetical protein
MQNETANISSTNTSFTVREKMEPVSDVLSEVVRNPDAVSSIYEKYQNVNGAALDAPTEEDEKSCKSCKKIASSLLKCHSDKLTLSKAVLHLKQDWDSSIMLAQELNNANKRIAYLENVLSSYGILNVPHPEAKTRQGKRKRAVSIDDHNERNSDEAVSTLNKKSGIKM